MHAYSLSQFLIFNLCIGRHIKKGGEQYRKDVTDYYLKHDLSSKKKQKAGGGGGAVLHLLLLILEHYAVCVR